MREQEMRLRVLRFLKARMRNMIMPATMGLGLAVAGCSDSKSLYMGPLPTDGPMGQETSGAKYDVPLETAPADGASDISILGPLDGQLPETASDFGIRDAMSLVDQAATLDTEKLDAGATEAAPPVDSSGDLGSIVAKYIAPILDAAPGDGAVVRYMSPFFDGSTPQNG
ncbi:MAG TPA: hypothetical protein VF550_04690 [Polyangia bacterium]